MSSPDDTWWNPRTQRWEPGPQPPAPTEPEPATQPEYLAPPEPAASPPPAPGHPAAPEPPAGTGQSAAPVQPARPEPHAPAQPQQAPGDGAGAPARPGWPAEYGRPAQPPAAPEPPAAPGHPVVPEYLAVPEYPAAPEYSAPPAPAPGSEDLTQAARPVYSAPPAPAPGSEDLTQVGGAAPGSAPAWYERPAQAGWNPGPTPGAGLPPLPPPTAPGYEAWPPLPPATPHQEYGAAPPWRTPLLVGVVAAVVGGAAVAAWMLLGDKTAPPADARPPAPSASAPATPGPGTPSTGGPSSASPTPSGSPSPSARPGFTVVHNEDGFSVAVPAGWAPSHDEQGGGAFYRPPGGDRSALLQIFRISEPASTGSCELLRMSSERLSSGTPAYQQVSMSPVDGSGCELVYEYDSAESHGRRRGMERIVATPDGGRWALLAAGPATDATTTRANLTAALDSFRPG
ncbi:hypothetical protein [Streptomyces sp. NPDC058157]|uniref:hypothetical protein n=1 Tax=Streptomyces sp. NPDC058157 TaxID=3346360 RepID=UPI0036EB3E05